MKFYLAVTDIYWYNNLSKLNPEDLNFWQPGGHTNFKLLSQGEPFLFKLKSPLNVIGGVGFFFKYEQMQLSLAWDIFGEKNGFDTFSKFQRAIISLRKDKNDLNPTIGCIVLTNPIFFKSKDWIKIPENWSNSIVQGKSYNTQEETGNSYWSRVQLLLETYMKDIPENDENRLIQDPESPVYGNPVLSKVRIGQGPFKISIFDSYNNRCSVSGERTRPVLEAAHIKPYSKAGPNLIRNGLLLRSDIHKLFDSGYITISKELKVEVSKRIKEEFENGREYYQYHGRDLSILPLKNEDKPFVDYVEWHNENVFRG